MKAQETTKPRAKKLTWESVARQNTGSHFLDSGSHYGYKYNAPLLKKPVLLGFSQWSDNEGKKHCEIETTINTVEFLKAIFKIDYKLTKKLHLKLDGSEGYQGASEVFINDVLKRDDLEFKSCENTYNYETDLDQVFQFSIIQPIGCLEWYYKTEQCYFLVETHNGCDVRGGYSDFIVCKISDSDNALKLFDMHCGVYISKATLDGVELTESERDELNQPYTIGYTSSPVHSFNKEIESIILEPGQSDNASDVESVTVKLKSGHIVTVHAEANFNY